MSQDTWNEQVEETKPVDPCTKCRNIIFKMCKANHSHIYFKDSLQK